MAWTCRIRRRAFAGWAAKSLFFCSVANALLSGCAHRPQDKIPTYPISKVIDEIKSELHAIPPQDLQVPAHGACAVGGFVRVVSIPSSATIALKTVATLSTNGSITLAIPIAPITGATIGPAFTETYTDIRTQVVTIDVNIAGSTAYLSNEIKQADADAKNFQTVQGDLKELLKDDPALLKKEQDALAAKIAAATMRKKQAEKDFGQLVLHPPNVVGVLGARLSPNLHLAQALVSAEKQLLNVSHVDEPCLKPQTIKIQVDFEVQQKSDLNPSVNLVVVKVSNDTSKTDDLTHSVIVTFDLTQGGTTTK